MTSANRADRARIESRLDIARRGAELLGRKRRVLEDDLEQLRLASDLQREEFEAAAREADFWLARAAAIDGAEGIARSAAPPTARAELEWRVIMGVRVPAEVEAVLPEVRAVSGSSALVFAARAHRAAAEAAVRHAASEEAVRRIAAELLTTRQRERAVTHRWMPRLEASLADLRRRLDDLEFEETLQVRWASGQNGIVLTRRGTSEDVGAPARVPS
ncbi:V-type ATP synthase subunit D [Microbacterium sp. X-17]|uniref:V-type ATP synthase subunit D n=1 Tax=Microbacterium sp. X-17 TaxID=3144404 RepID=UPI0031F49014